ncbi:synaptotagmin-1-like [Macrobrachium rosenbergii]|uniref:synaptotagmin-1-like n=1 Tax=Macrobrachium rosenbergii TaxID=79674 RepID=UPI0034D72F08
MYVLTPMSRLAMIAGGVGIVAVAIVIVVCVVGPGCWLNNLLLNEEERRRREKERQSIFATEAPTLKLTTYSGKTPEGPPTYPDLPLTHTPGQTPTHTKYTYISPLHTGSAETNALLGALSSKRDSTYSSMSEYSGRTSPTNSCRSSVGDSVGSGVGSPVGGDAQGQLSFGIQYVANGQDTNTGKLIITVMEAHGLPGKEYLGTACDAYVKVVIWKERRSLRKQKSPPLHNFKTRTIRHTHDPAFNQSFVVETNKTQLKELVVKLVVMDADKWASPTTVGEVIQPLRDIKNLATIDHKTTLNYFMAPPKLDFGEVLFGLSYLPTAQRLSVSVIKASNLKYTNVVEDINDFCPYIRVLLISGSGRVLKKKKTTWRPGTASPVWNETLIFDLPQSQVEHVTFLLVMCTRPRVALTPTASDTSRPPDDLPEENPCDLTSPLHDLGHNKKQDRYVGKLALGCHVKGDEQRRHWLSIMAAPRKVVSKWHALK